MLPTTNIKPYPNRFSKFKKLFEEFSYWKIVASIYAIILFIANFIRIFDNNFWGDEAYTANLVMSQSMWGIIKTTAADVHPPLYYFFVKIGYELVGNQGWMFHFISLIPCAIILLFSLTCIWNRFGKGTAIILITLTTLSANAVKYNVEVRMYSWAALFIFLTFYYLHRILSEEKNKDYILFTVFSLVASYTHYYCLLSVSFFYLSLLYLSFFRRSLSRKKVLLSCFCFMIGYLPWLFIFLHSFFKRVGNYWIKEIPTFKVSLKYLFSNQISYALYFIVFLLFFMKQTGIARLEKFTNKKYNLLIDLSNLKFSVDLTWSVIGTLSIIGTIGVAIVVSKTITPFYILRYIYPVSIVAWIILGRMVSHIRFNRALTFVLLLYMLFSFIPSYLKTYKVEKKQNNVLQKTLSVMKENNIKAEDIILSNHRHIPWAIAQYYFPDNKSKQITLSKIPNLDEGTVYWLIVTGKQNMEPTFEQLKDQGFSCEQIIENGIFGTMSTQIYRIEKQVRSKPN